MFKLEESDIKKIKNIFCQIMCILFMIFCIYIIIQSLHFPYSFFSMLLFSILLILDIYLYFKMLIRNNIEKIGGMNIEKLFNNTKIAGAERKMYRNLSFRGKISYKINKYVEFFSYYTGDLVDDIRYNIDKIREEKEERNINKIMDKKEKK